MIASPVVFQPAGMMTSACRKKTHHNRQQDEAKLDGFLCMEKRK